MMEIADQREDHSSGPAPRVDVPLGLLHKLAPYCRPETIVFLFTWVALLAIGPSRLFRDPGTLYHPVFGKIMLESGRLIYTDPFSFTHGGEHWIAQWWLADCFLALLHKWGGFDLILLTTATLLAGLFTWIAHRLMMRGLHPLLAILVTALAAMAGSYHFHPRPHLATIAGMAVTVAWLCDFEAGRRSLRSLFWLVPVYVLWTNLHGGMVGGVATIAIAVVGWTVAWLIGLESPIKRWYDVMLSVALVLCCALTALMNPYGTDMLRAWFGLMFSPVLPQTIIEHMPLKADEVGYAVAVVAVVYTVAFLGVLPKRPRVTWLLPFVWFCLALSRVRHGPLFAVTAAIVLGDMLPHVRWLHWLARHGSHTAVIRPRAPATGPVWMRLRPALAPSALIIVAVALQLTDTRFPLIGAGRIEADPDETPIGLLPELHALARDPAVSPRVFNDMEYGGFLIYYAPELRIFMDDRCELYGDQGLLDYKHAFEDDQSQVDCWQEQYGFKVALVKSGTKFDKYLQASDKWERVKESGKAVLYRWKGP